MVSGSLQTNEVSGPWVTSIQPQNNLHMWGSKIFKWFECQAQVADLASILLLPLFAVGPPAYCITFVSVHFLLQNE